LSYGQAKNHQTPVLQPQVFEQPLQVKFIPLAVLVATPTVVLQAGD
jgi:hypothetical protein